MSDKRGYSAPTLGTSPKGETRIVKQPSAPTGEQVVAEVMRLYRDNDMLAAQNRALSDKIKALEGGRDLYRAIEGASEPSEIDLKLRKIGMDRLRECIVAGRSAKSYDDTVMKFDQWAKNAVYRDDIPDCVSMEDFMGLFHDELAEAYELRRAEAEKSIAEKAASKENEGDDRSEGDGHGDAVRGWQDVHDVGRRPYHGDLAEAQPHPLRR